MHISDMDKKFVNFVGNNAVIKYSNGDSCSSDSTKSISTLITFICEAGESNRGPSKSWALTSVSEDECDLEFEWKTSAGCVQSEHFGQDCHVFAVKRMKSRASPSVVMPSVKPSKFVWNLGLPSSDISYFDRFINLTMGLLTMIKKRHRDKFQMVYVSRVPSDLSVCLVTDFVNRKQYDLSSLIQKSGSDNWEVVAEFNSNSFAGH
uniref:MRH domain-containing protein n=1 Tax=Strigamia maritima TaxID=126957 RepID=T1JC92_STRMM